MGQALRLYWELQCFCIVQASISGILKIRFIGNFAQPIKLYQIT